MAGPKRKPTKPEPEGVPLPGVRGVRIVSRYGADPERAAKALARLLEEREAGTPQEQREVGKMLIDMARERPLPPRPEANDDAR